MVPFDDRFHEMHEQIQKNKSLVSRVFALSESFDSLRMDEIKRYYPIETTEPFHLGLDHSGNHCRFYEEILSKMRILYEESDGKIDLPKVYFLLENRRGILSEDLTGNDYYRLTDRTEFNLLNPVLGKVFQSNKLDLEKTTFQIEGWNYLRNPVIDLDHVKVKPEYEKVLNIYTQHYKNKNNFLIKNFN